MNEQIIQNLYNFWETIGILNQTYTHEQNYSVVSNQNSDWPNRIFRIRNEINNIQEITQLIGIGKLPPIITVDESFLFNESINFSSEFSQLNMALNLPSLSQNVTKNENIQKIHSKEDCIDFAITATKSFGYHVDPLIIEKIITSDNIKAYLYREEQNSLGCGILFFDSNNNAGLHMIGTISEARNKGIGKKITKHLLSEAIENNKQTCVLHASKAGEVIYKKLGFIGYGQLKTYILNCHKD